MDIVDAQVHIFEADSPERPWRGSGHSALPAMPAAQLVAMMDDAGIAAAILVSAWSNYRFDPSLALATAANYSGRFGVVAPVDPDRPDMDEFVAHWKTLPHTVGLRLMLLPEAEAERSGPGPGALLRAAQAYQVPLCVEARGNLDRIAPMLDEHPDLLLVIDHLGLEWTLEPPLAELETLLALARYPNVRVKATGTPALSRQPYPFADLWPALHAVFDAFTLQRVMWGTDWTRTTDLLSLRESVTTFTQSGELSDSELAQVMGKTARSVFSAFSG
jgi:predicted TIM-barrel fold metal-dependent hydrolase